MKKGLLVGLFVVLLFISVTFADASGYPEIRTDPATGETYDFNGQDVYIYNFWSGESDWDDCDYDSLTDREKAQYDYRKWLEETYNVKIHYVQRGDWGHALKK